MGDQLVIYNSQGALALRTRDPAQEAAEQEKRIKDALELEAKLKMINETIPTRVYNTSSSTAGAGSGDFHQYRIVRRTEQLRVKRIEDDFNKKKVLDEFEARKREREQQLEEQTAKRRAKRLKKKAKQQGKKAAATAGAASGSQKGAEAEAQEGSSSDGEEAEAAAGLD